MAISLGQNCLRGSLMLRFLVPVLLCALSVLRGERSCLVAAWSGPSVTNRYCISYCDLRTEYEMLSTSLCAFWLHLPFRTVVPVPLQC